VIFLIIGLLFRSLRVGLIAALPNTTPLLLTLGYMGWRGYDMNAGNVIVFTISLGIAVDDTIHLLYRFREEHHTQPNVVQATRSALAGTGPAIVLTSLLIVGGLAVLLFSQFVPTRRFAELLIVTMGGALVGDLLLLPACLVLFSAKQKPDSKELAGTPDSRTAETSECAITVAMNSGQD
jgi:predicted RND superfamily exporter protein